MTNWKEVLIADLKEVGQVDIQTGPFGTQFKAHEYVEEGIPMINVKNIGMGKIRPDKIEFISDRTAKRLKNHLLRKDDIVFGRKGAVERHVFIRKEQEGWIQGSDCIRVRFDSKNILPEYVSYYLCTQYHQIWINNLASSGATMSSLNQEIIGRIKFNLPDFSIQSKIVSVLSNYDKLIENNNRRIALLEEMAEEIYKEWFVRLRFPNWKETKVVDGIPEGWSVEPLSMVSENFSRKRKPLSTMIRRNKQGIYPYYGAAKIIDYIDDYIFEGKYLLLAEDGSVITKDGGPVLQLVNNKFWVSNHAHVLRGKGEVSLNYLYLFLNKYPIISHVTGAAQPKINQENLNRIKVLRPKKGILIQFNEIVNPMFEEMHILKKKNINLQKTRDLLLPRLVSGKLSVEHLTESK